ncbi:HAD hydrolase-like protein, partial [Acinetobacter baumannii]|uniref:HAD hydrolase-like protein n=1 Tax=Acinetobacter baumannii TaxID=470 RepID=UPI001C438EDB
MEKNLKEYQAIIFDVDGTLTDSFHFFLSVFNQLSANYQFKSVSPPEVDYSK